jgi:hypothetical protein
MGQKLRRVLIIYRRFGTCRSHLHGSKTASCGNYLPTFRDNVSVPSSWVKNGVVWYLFTDVSGRVGPIFMGQKRRRVVIIYRRFGSCRSHLHGSTTGRVVIIYRRFGTTCRSHLHGSKTVSCGNYLPTFRDVSVPSSWVKNGAVW